MKPILVIKFGTAAITTEKGELNEDVIRDIARQVSVLHRQYHIVMVSSGAVAAGKSYLSKYSRTLSERKAAAAIGNPLLITKYAHEFAPYGIAIAQSLCERHHFSNRGQFLQLKKTYEKLWDNNIIPIANENDVVSNLELKFSDNDELATLIAVGFKASVLLFSTSVPGVLDKDKQVVPLLDTSDKNSLLLANKEKSASGLGGMTSKLTFARLANQMGIKAVIFGIKTPDGILKAVKGETGTVCMPQPCTIPARNRWLASGSIAKGRVKIDAGACKALQDRHSLLAVGVKAITGDFEAGEVFEILDEKGEAVAVAKARISSQKLGESLKTVGVEVAHANDIVLL
ncbi:glutamate 5-kinase [Pedobacter sp. BS3]|uniref:glutamate 5-kinase n=1 Tax=Pedobacter sp. BS3 TaxID=2567937 RepID=UPI0011EE0F04|nr:glutamate 5-kinase [Pedobacter sp. BS3]TZF84493.1 glutamate 5-kinase [Pedobacter sp. BS3]